MPPASPDGERARAATQPAPEAAARSTRDGEHSHPSRAERAVWVAWADADLLALIEQAWRAHPDVRSALAAVVQARAALTQAQALQGPAVTAGSSAARTRVGDAAAATRWQAQLDGAWELDWLGRRTAGTQAAQQDLAAAAADAALARQTVAANVALAWIEVWSASERLRLARENVQALQHALRLTLWRAQAGLASEQDAATARASVAQAEAAVPAIEAQWQQARHALAVLTGQTPQAELPQPTRAPEPPSAWTMPTPASVLARRADVAAAEARLRAAVARVRQADAARWPGLTLGGTLSWSAPRVSDLFDVQAMTRSLVLRLVATVFDGGSAQAQVLAQEAAVERARAALAGTLLAALKDVENALSALAAVHVRRQRLDAAERDAAVAEQLAAQRYAAGLTDLRSLLDAQRTLIGIRTDVVQAQADWAAQHVRLRLALGAESDEDAADRRGDRAATHSDPSFPHR